jgi:hypothetical protein
MKSIRFYGPRVLVAVAVVTAVVLLFYLALRGGRPVPLTLDLDFKSWRLGTAEFAQDDQAGNWHSGRVFVCGPASIYYHRSDFYRRDNAKSTNNIGTRKK